MEGRVKEMNMQERDMAYQIERLKGPDGQPVLTAGELDERIGKLTHGDGPRLRRLWAYYRNTMRPAPDPSGGDSARPYRQAQEWGLPSRITGVRSGREVFGSESVNGLARKEVVIENDIGWRIEAGIIYPSVFGNCH